MKLLIALLATLVIAATSAVDDEDFGEPEVTLAAKLVEFEHATVKLLKQMTAYNAYGEQLVAGLLVIEPKAPREDRAKVIILQKLYFCKQGTLAPIFITALDQQERPIFNKRITAAPHAPEDQDDADELAFMCENVEQRGCTAKDCI